MVTIRRHLPTEVPLPNVTDAYTTQHTYIGSVSLVWFILRLCQRDDGYIDGLSQIYVHIDEQTKVHSDQSSLVVTRPSRPILTGVDDA